jgi:hypothetical protein
VIAVLAERARVGEGLEAVLAPERPLSRVQPSVLRQVVLVLEGLVTNGARVGTGV